MTDDTTPPAPCPFQIWGEGIEWTSTAPTDEPADNPSNGASEEVQLDFFSSN